ncbi:MAG: hypothetical protein WA723_18110, partial [Pseudolabrys sp.]
RASQSWSEQQNHLLHLAQTQPFFRTRNLPTRPFSYGRHISFRLPMQDVTEFGKRLGKMLTNCRPPFA